MSYSVEKSIKAKGLMQDNYLQHLDEMTDEEITYKHLRRKRYWSLSICRMIS